MMDNLRFDVSFGDKGMTISSHPMNHALLVRSNETDQETHYNKTEIMNLISDTVYLSASNDNEAPISKAA